MRSSLITVVLAAAAAAGPLRPAPPALKVTVSSPAEFEHSKDLYAIVELTNTGEDTVEINSLNTAFFPLDTNDFLIYRKTSAVGGALAPAFVGTVDVDATEPAAVREAGALLRLAAGESKSANVTLGNRYDFTQSGVGAYSIGVPAKFSVIADGAIGFETVTATVEPAIVNLKGALVSKRNVGELAERSEFWLCSQIQQIQLATLITKAESGAAKALLSLHGPSSLYTTWFGTWDDARASTIRSAYLNMTTLFRSLKYDCTQCNFTRRVAAYIYHDRPGTVYLCDIFWTDPELAGNLNKMGALIHEASHWANFGATKDIVFGPGKSSTLAFFFPTDAVRNADNYRYYFVDVNK